MSQTDLLYVHDTGGNAGVGIDGVGGDDGSVGMVFVVVIVVLAWCC